MEPEVIKQFRIGPKGLRYIRLVSIVWALLFCLVIWIFFLHSSSTVNGKPLSEKANYLISAIIVGGLFVITLTIRMVKINDLYKNIVFVLHPDVLERNKKGLKRLGFYYNDINRIVRTYRGSFMIYTSAGMQMMIPHFIDNRDQFEESLRSHFSTIEAGPYNFYQKYYVALTYLVIALMIGVLVAPNKIIISICCFMIVALFTVFLVNQYRRMKQAAHKVDLKLLAFPVGVIFITLVTTAIRLIK
ncbi:MAG: hypothetical protein ACHQHN_14310 [Sphingobacteriales bacterium]